MLNDNPTSRYLRLFELSAWAKGLHDEHPAPWTLPISAGAIEVSKLTRVAVRTARQSESSLVYAETRWNCSISGVSQERRFEDVLCNLTV